MTIFPNQAVPALILPTISGGTFNLHGTIANTNTKVTPNSDTAKHNYTLLVFYRGIHCPICLGHLKQIEAYYSDILKTNMSIVAISMDTKEKAIAMKDAVTDKSEAKLKLPLAYGLTAKQAMEWGLYLSAGRPDTVEPNVFSEPGLFVVDGNKKLFFVTTQSAPFSRPNMEELVGRLSWARANHYPARGQMH